MYDPQGFLVPLATYLYVLYLKSNKQSILYIIIIKKSYSLIHCKQTQDT